MFGCKIKTDFSVWYEFFFFSKVLCLQPDCVECRIYGFILLLYESTSVQYYWMKIVLPGEESKSQSILGKTHLLTSWFLYRLWLVYVFFPGRTNYAVFSRRLEQFHIKILNRLVCGVKKCFCLLWRSIRLLLLWLSFHSRILVLSWIYCSRIKFFVLLFKLPLFLSRLQLLIDDIP